MLRILKSRYFILLLLVSFITILPVMDAYAIAQDTTYFQSNDMVRVMCNVMGLITGGLGKTFAAFAIISLGIGFFAGKISWGTMIGMALGIAAMFGAPTIVDALTGASFSCSTAFSGGGGQATD